MNSETPSQPRLQPTARNPRTLAKFRRETWWQITFPMLMVFLILIGGVVGLGLWRGEDGFSVVADYSLILVILPLLLVGLIALALVIALIYVTVLAMEKIPPYTYIAHQKAFDVRHAIVSTMNRITGFIISLRSMFDGFWHFLAQRGFVPEQQPETTSTTTGEKP